MAQIRLKVSTDVLQAKAQEITGQINRIENSWKRMASLIQNSRSYWQGDASDCHQNFLKDNQDDVERLLRRLKEHPEDLQKMAGIYVEAEKAAEQAAAALPTDVIV